MSHSGPLGTILPILGSAALLATGAGAAGIGPLAGMFSAGDAAATAGAGLAAGALPGEAAAAAATGGALPAVTAGADALGPAMWGGGGEAAFQAGLTGVPEATSAALPTVGSLGGSALPIATQVAANTLPGIATDAVTGLPGAATATATNPFDAGLIAAGQDSSIVPSTGGGAGGAPAATFGGDFAEGDPTTEGTLTPSGTSWWQKPQNLLALAPLALMGGQALFGDQLPPGGQAVQTAAQSAAQEAGVLTGQAQQNISAAQTGALPPGAQAAIDSAANAAKAQVRSSFASMGVPAGSTMEAQQLAAVDENTAAQKFDISMKLTQQGIQEAQTAAGFSQQDIAANEVLMSARIQQEKDFEAALANWSAAMAGGWSGGGGNAVA